MIDSQDKFQLMMTMPDEFSAFCLLNQSRYLQDIKEVDKHFRYGSIGIVMVWLGLVSLVYFITPEENLERVEGLEQYISAFAFVFIFLSLSGRIITIIMLEDRNQVLSGILIGFITVQVVAMVTNLLMASGLPTPVMRDPFFGNRVHMLRWCEWSPLAFYMTFVTVGISTPLDGESQNDVLKSSYKLGAFQGFSTLMAIFLPYCNRIELWYLCMAISTFFFSFIFPCLYSKWRRFTSSKPENSCRQMELYHRARLSFQLMLVCTSAWTLLVILFMISGFCYKFGIGGILKDESFGMVWESIMDVISKNLYMSSVVQAHKAIFDDKERAERRLSELRRLMCAVWESSSDVICLSVRGISGSIRTLASTAYLRIYHGISTKSGDCNKALLFDIDIDAVQTKSYSNIQAKNVQAVEFNSASEAKSQSLSGIFPNLEQNLLSSMAGLIARSWNAEKNGESINHKLLKKSTLGRIFTPCEANVCQLDNDSILVVIRDISERSQRFEAEKKMIFETTARKKDLEANRFTRHEVKNGILAAIGLCENLKESTAKNAGPLQPYLSNPHQKTPQKLKAFTKEVTHSGTAPEPPSSGNYSLPPHSPNISLCTQELDKTLKDILDTIQSEAMARDVIHGVYEPKMERVDILEALGSSVGSDVAKKFPIVVNPCPLPSLYLDPQLLKCIHRNAVSNAYKYGKKGGIVTTMVHFDRAKMVLKLDIINQPGDNHHHLVELGGKANDLVFSPGTRLHDEAHITREVSSHSSGDGAWIMRKCAQTLQGRVEIKFEPGQTLFSFSCPARLFDDVMMTKVLDPQTFQLPLNIWGVAIDDSKIQRKLLGSFLTFAGVEPSRQIIMGGTTSEIKGFDNYVVQLINNHPNDYFLLIVDENLDILEYSRIQATVSGSKCIENIRSQLSPDKECRLLALVRSANDSADDVAKYNTRAHGFISKAPIRKSAVVETIAPLWEKRFMYKAQSSVTKLKDFEKISASKMQDNSNAGSELAKLVLIELQGNLDAIDELCSGESNSLLDSHWPLIWEKLHRLKGDLLSSFNTPAIRIAVSDIDSMRGLMLPQNFLSRWQTLRSHVSTNIALTETQGNRISRNNEDGRLDKRGTNVSDFTARPISKKMKTNPMILSKLPPQQEVQSALPKHHLVGATREEPAKRQRREIRGF